MSGVYSGCEKENNIFKQVFSFRNKLNSLFYTYLSLLIGFKQLHFNMCFHVSFCTFFSIAIVVSACYPQVLGRKYWVWKTRGIHVDNIKIPLHKSAFSV